MADIFISYSSNDSEKADQLIALLASAGLSVWIDRQGIVGAEKWATEIVEGINSCSTFILLISPHSIESENVLKELSLASEKRKRVLPVDLEFVKLPSSFEYPLAGMQRLAISDFDGILRAHKHGVSRVVLKDLRKSLMVLPFKDLSRTQDNSWFADGMTGELIDALSHLKALRVIDRNTSMDFKSFKGRTRTIAQEMDVRYFIQGDVRKAGEQIKISVSLLDIETGDYLWQDSHRGEFKDIFDIQESVADKIVEGLKLHLTKSEESLLDQRGTENSEAYELHLKANEYFHQATKEGFTHALQLFGNAIELDPNYVAAYKSKAIVLVSLYRDYDRDIRYLAEAESLVREALSIKPDYWEVYSPLSDVYRFQGRLKEAEETAMEFVRIAPENFMSHFTLGFFYMETDQDAKAIPAYDACLQLKPGSLPAIANLVIVCKAAGEEEQCRSWSLKAIPYFQRYLKFHPEDEGNRVMYASILHYAGKSDEARAVAQELQHVRDGNSLYNTACLFDVLGEPLEALHTFRAAILAGFQNIKCLKNFLEEGSVHTLRGSSEYDEVRNMVEEIERVTVNAHG